MTFKGKTPHERAYHPLFPVADDADPALLAKRDISWLYIWRNKELHEDCPYPADAFQDPSDLVRKWGGGVYEIRAKDAEKKGYTANATYSFSGPAKTFNTPEPRVAAPAPDNNNSQIVIGLVTAVTPIITALIEQGRAREDRLAREAEQREERRREEMKLEYAKIEARMKAEQSASIEQTKLLMGAMQNNNTTTQVLGALEKGMQLGSQMRGDGDDELIETVGAFLGGFNGGKQPAGPPS